jgi:uroporphyrinogen-III synthase
MAASILITRPGPAGTTFADRLRTKLGEKCTIFTSPLMRIETCANLPDLSGIGTLIFTSRHAVETFEHLSKRRDIPAYAVGEVTGQIAKRIGLSVTMGDGDAARLIARIQRDKPAQPCLHIRGEHVAAPLAQMLTKVEIETHEAIVYMQRPLALSEDAQRLLQREEAVILPLFSPRSAKLLFSQPGVTHWQADIHIVTISAAVADNVPMPWATTTEVAPEPTAAAMGDTVQRLWAKLNRLEGGQPAQ